MDKNRNEITITKYEEEFDESEQLILVKEFKGGENGGDYVLESYNGVEIKSSDGAL